MARGTRQKRTARIATASKATSAHRKADLRRASRKGSVPRVLATSKAKSVGRPSPRQFRKPQGKEQEAALKNFETAVRHFRKRDYAKAVVLFEKIAAGPVREIADRARVHLRFCERKRYHETSPKTAEGYYARGVAALNSRDFDHAVQYLNKSNKMVPNQEYVHYALAAAYGLRGDLDNALSHLDMAIKLRPQNRLQARRDEDFQVLSSDPRFARLLAADNQRPST